MSDWAAELHKSQASGAVGTTHDWAGELTKPKTFDEANAQRDAQTHTVVDVPRLERAQGLRDMGLNDPRAEGNPDVPIDGFMRTEAPPIQPANAANFGASLKSDLVEDPDTKRRLVADSLKIDPSRVGFIDDHAVYVDDNGQLRSVSSSLARHAAGAVAGAPEFIGATAGSLSGWPVVGAVAGAAGARGLKRAAAGLIFDDPETVTGNLTDVAAEGAVNAVAGGLGKGAAAVLGRGKVVDFTPADIRTAEQARVAIKNATGIDVDLAQASGNNKLIALRAYAARFPGKSAELVQAAEEAQKGQLDAAVTRVLDHVAKGAPAEVAGSNGINAAQLVIELAKGARNKAVRPFYEAAEKVSLAADVAEGLNADPILKAARARIMRDPIYQKDLQGTRPDSVKLWHYIKQDMDDQISAAKEAGQTNRVRLLTQSKNDLNAKLEAASPEYKEANAYYSKVTREQIEPLENSAIGVLARITNPKATTAAGRIFSDPNISAAEIRATRASIVQNKGGAEAWDGLVRQWMATNWNKALKETQTGSQVNAAGKLRQALIGTPEQKAKTAAMMPPGALQAFDDLMTACQALSRTPTAGSNTMRDTEIRDQLRGQGAVLFKWLTSARASLTNAAEQRAVERNTVALTEALLDPAKQQQLRQVVKMSDAKKKVAVIVSVLGGQSLERAAASVEDVVPPAYQPKSAQ